MFEFADTLLSTGRTPFHHSAPIASKPEAAYLKASEVPLSLKFPWILHCGWCFPYQNFSVSPLLRGQGVQSRIAVTWNRDVPTVRYLALSGEESYPEPLWCPHIHPHTQSCVLHTLGIQWYSLKERMRNLKRTIISCCLQLLLMHRKWAHCVVQSVQQISRHV